MRKNLKVGFEIWDICRNFTESGKKTQFCRRHSLRKRSLSTRISLLKSSSRLIVSRYVGSPLLNAVVPVNSRDSKMRAKALVTLQFIWTEWMPSLSRINFLFSFASSPTVTSSFWSFSYRKPSLNCSMIAYSTNAPTTVVVSVVASDATLGLIFRARL